MAALKTKRTRSSGDAPDTGELPPLSRAEKMAIWENLPREVKESVRLLRGGSYGHWAVTNMRKSLGASLDFLIDRSFSLNPSTDDRVSCVQKFIDKYGRLPRAKPIHGERNMYMRLQSLRSQGLSKPEWEILRRSPERMNALALQEVGDFILANGRLPRQIAGESALYQRYYKLNKLALVPREWIVLARSVPDDIKIEELTKFITKNSRLPVKKGNGRLYAWMEHLRQKGKLPPGWEMMRSRPEKATSILLISLFIGEHGRLPSSKYRTEMRLYRMLLRLRKDGLALAEWKLFPRLEHEPRHRSKLTQNQIARIRRRAESSDSYKVIGAAYGVSATTVCRIVNNESYGEKI
jgi:hypothetical protein